MTSDCTARLLTRKAFGSSVSESVFAARLSGRSHFMPKKPTQNSNRRYIRSNIATRPQKPRVRLNRVIGVDDLRKVVAWLQRQPVGDWCNVRLDDPTAFHLLNDLEGTLAVKRLPAETGETFARYQLTRPPLPPLPSLDTELWDKFFDEIGDGMDY